MKSYLINENTPGIQMSAARLISRGIKRLVVNELVKNLDAYSKRLSLSHGKDSAILEPTAKYFSKLLKNPISIVSACDNIQASKQSK